MFLDESGEANINKPDPRFNIFVLCGIIFSEVSYNSFNENVNKIKIKYWGTTDIIFHSVEMRNQTNAFKIFQDKKLLSAFYEDIGKIFTESDYTVFSCIVNKEKYKERYPYKNHAYEDALMFLCERGISLIKSSIGNNSLHLCLEKRGKGKDRYLKKHYTQFKKYGTTYVSTADFRMCAEKLHFRDKNQNTNGLQFADLCAYPLARKHLTPDKIQPTFEVFKHKIFSKYGRTIGYGIKLFP